MIDPVSSIAEAFATPPSIEAALARTPASPVARRSGMGGSDGQTPSSPTPDPSAVARFRQALALHEDLAAARAAAGSQVPGRQVSSSDLQPATCDLRPGGEAAAPATRESLAASASATLAQSAAFGHGSAQSARQATGARGPSMSSRTSPML